MLNAKTMTKSFLWNLQKLEAIVEGIEVTTEFTTCDRKVVATRNFDVTNVEISESIYKIRSAC